MIYKVLTVIAPEGFTSYTGCQNQELHWHSRFCASGEHNVHFLFLEFLFLFLPPKVVVPFDVPAALLDTRDGSNEVEEAVSYPGVSPEVDEGVDAGVA